MIERMQLRHIVVRFIKIYVETGETHLKCFHREADVTLYEIDHRFPYDISLRFR